MNTHTKTLTQTIKPYWELMRFHRPVGTLLLLWPTWWALWLAAGGFPDWHLLVIFTLGVTVMRAAGCVINDIADRHVDGHVSRTRQRPLVSGQLTVRQAWVTFFVMVVVAFILVLFTNRLTILLSFAAVGVAALYPFMKRYTHLPQVVLGVAFSMGIPMGFAAQSGEVTGPALLLFVTSVLWIVVYDTYYGMTDREYDKKIGVKSTAILFEGAEAMITGSLQLLVLVGLAMVGQRFDLGIFYYLSLLVSAGFMVYQQRLIATRKPDAYFAAFINNQWVGCAVFVGIALSVSG